MDKTIAEATAEAVTVSSALLSLLPKPFGFTKELGYEYWDDFYAREIGDIIRREHLRAAGDASL